VRELPAGRATTFVLRGGRSFANELLVAGGLDAAPLVSP